MKTKEQIAQETEAKNQRICQQLVHREILHCCSIMVWELAQNEKYIDDILELCTGQNWEDAAYDAGWRKNPNVDSDYTYYNEDEENEKPEPSNAKNWRELCEEQCIDPYDVEVFEHWAVTDWFAEQLKKHSEIIGELFDFTIWGRCTTGQAIYMDGVIREIASDMEILVGQENEWKD